MGGQACVGAARQVMARNQGPSTRQSVPFHDFLEFLVAV